MRRRGSDNFPFKGYSREKRLQATTLPQRWETKRGVITGNHISRAYSENSRRFQDKTVSKSRQTNFNAFQVRRKRLFEKFQEKQIFPMDLRLTQK